MIYNKFIEFSNELKGDVIAFAQKLIQTPSLSGSEGDVAQLCLNEMKKLGYDEVFIDDIGNVVGIIKGTGDGPNIMFNSHMDHVDPGDESNWEYPPYGAVIADGYIHGRSASDVKGGLAAQIYAGAILKKLGVKPKGDFIFTGVVQEEPAEMFGMKYLCDKTFVEKGIKFDLMVSSEATAMDIYLGHRGRIELEIITKGRTSHGSAPWRGINAINLIVPVIDEIQKLSESLPEHKFLGKSTIAPTIISCSPGRLSIIPDRCFLCVDRRIVPGETKEEVLGQIQRIFDNLKQTVPNFNAEVRIRKVVETSYKGYSEECEKYMMPWNVHSGNLCGLRACRISQWCAGRLPY